MSDDQLGGAIANQQHFPFLALPPETQLNILKNTDLVSPTRWYCWALEQGFYLFERDRRRNSLWRSPLSLFLVSKSLQEMGHQVFWRYNTFCISAIPPGQSTPEYVKFKMQDKTRSLGAHPAISFFNRYASATTDLRSVVIIGDVDPSLPPNQDAHDADREWLTYAGELISDRGLKLDCLQIHMDGFPRDVSAWSSLKELPDDVKITAMRNFFHRRAWPLLVQNELREIPRHMTIRLFSLRSVATYELRWQGKKRPVMKDECTWCNHITYDPRFYEATRMLYFPRQEGDVIREDTSEEGVCWAESVWFQTAEEYWVLDDDD